MSEFKSSRVSTEYKGRLWSLKFVEGDGLE